MRKQMSKGGLRTVLSLLVMCVMVGVFLKYSETASSQQKGQKRESGAVADAQTAIENVDFVSHKADGFAISPPVAQLKKPEVRISRKPEAEEKDETLWDKSAFLGEAEEK